MKKSHEKNYLKNKESRFKLFEMIESKEGD